MKALTDKLGQFQGLIATVFGIFALFGIDRVGLLAVLNPLQWAILEPLVVAAVTLIVGFFIVRQIYAAASRLKDPNALRLDPKSRVTYWVAETTSPVSWEHCPDD